MSSGPPPYVDSSEVVALLRDKTKTPGKDFVIVDVREVDFKYGNIPSAINIHAADMLEAPEKQLDKILENKPQTVIFHCALSQVRGPKSANAFAQALKNVPGPKPDVVVLRGGFNEWQKQHRETDLVENLDAAAWDQGIMF